MNKKIENFTIPFDELGITDQISIPNSDKTPRVLDQGHHIKDLDGDGDSDLVLIFGVFPESVMKVYPLIYENKGDGTLEKVEIKNQKNLSEGYGEVGFGDFNLDGKLDVVIGSLGYDTDPWGGMQPILYLSNEDGSYTDSTDLFPQEKMFMHSLSVGDVNNDGYDDIFFGNVVRYSLPTLLINEGGESFKKAELPEGIFDFTFYTTPDKPISEGGIRIHNNTYLSSHLVDIDNDNILELVLPFFSQYNDNGGVHKFETSFILDQDGQGNFGSSPSVLLPKPLYGINPANEGEQGAIVMDISSGDINGDGLLDLLMNETTREPYYAGRKFQILIQQTDGSFKDETSGRLIGFVNEGDTIKSVTNAQFIDIDKDGDLDIAYNNNPGGIKYDLSYQSVIFNYGNGHFIVSGGVGNGDVTNWNPNAWSYDGEDSADKFFVAFNYDNGDAFYFTYVNNVVDWSVEDDTDNELVLTISQIEINEPKYQLSANLDATKNVLEAHSEEVISGTLNFNDGNNIVILDGQAKTYRGLIGDDTYFVSQLLPKNGKVSITDTEGANIIQIPSNTYVDKSLFTKNAARLTLEDGREITINGADKFSYNVGGNVTDGTAGTDLTYADFATSFGVSDILNSSGAQTGVISDMYII